MNKFTDWQLEALEEEEKGGVRDELNKAIKCIECDGSGGIQISEDEAQQCQFCAEIREPAIKTIISMFERETLKARMNELESIPKKDAIKYGISNQPYLTKEWLNNRIKQLEGEK